MLKFKDYENVVMADIVLLCFHLLATFVIFNQYMFVSIGLIRLPRLALHFVH